MHSAEEFIIRVQISTTYAIESEINVDNYDLPTEVRTAWQEVRSAYLAYRDSLNKFDDVVTNSGLHMPAVPRDRKKEPS